MKIEKLKGDHMCTLPEPGVYSGVDDETYHSWPGASSSRLRTLKRTPAHLKYEMDNPKEPTPEMMIGRAYHSLALEGGDLWKLMLPGKQAKTREKYQARVQDMVTALGEHKDISQFMSHMDEKELTLVWDDPDTKVRCKAKLDGYISKSGTIVDLKSTVCAAEYKFFSSGAKFGYHIQAAMYLKGAQVLGLKAKDFVFIAQEKEAPYLPNIYPVKKDAIEIGEFEFEDLIKKYKVCTDQGYWPGYAVGAEYDLPDWYKMGGDHE